MIIIIIILTGKVAALNFSGKGEPLCFGFDGSVLTFNLRKTHNESVLGKPSLCHFTRASKELMFRNSIVADFMGC